MIYRGKDPRATVTGSKSGSTSKSKYRGAPVGGAPGYYQGRPGRATTSTATTTPAGTLTRPARGAAGGATGTPRMAGRAAGGATNNRAMLRDQISQLRQQQLRDQIRYLRQQGLIDV